QRPTISRTESVPLHASRRAHRNAPVARTTAMTDAAARPPGTSPFSPRALASAAKGGSGPPPAGSAGERGDWAMPATAAMDRAPVTIAATAGSAEGEG